MIKGEGSAASMSCISLCHNKRTILRHRIGDDQLIIPDDEILASGLYHFFGDDRQLVGDENMLHLHHETFNQADISFRNTS